MKCTINRVAKIVPRKRPAPEAQSLGSITIEELTQRMISELKRVLFTESDIQQAIKEYHDEAKRENEILRNRLSQSL